MGAFTVGPCQVVIYDTAGVVDSRHYRSQRHEGRVRSAWRTAASCDLLIFLVDAHRQVC
jgi:GTP-binding protein Era